MTDQTVSNPWEHLRRPSRRDPVSGLRVDASHPWSLYWAIDSDGRPLLAFRHAVTGAASLRLPRVNGVEVSHGRATGSTDDLLLLTLTDQSLRDVFWRLCLDIVDSTRSCRSEGEAVAVFVRRTWRWHHLLRGGSAAQLSREAQMGLIGELAVLDRFVLPHTTPAAAVDGWLGPERAPKDFELGHVGIEAKAHGPAARDEVQISSIDQLSRAGLSALYLCVTRVASSTDPQLGATVTEIADALRSSIEKSDPAALGTFDAKLTAAGLDSTHDYSDSKWVVGETVVFEVREEFPRIEPSLVSPSIVRVQYALRLTDCEEFIVSSEDLVSTLAGEAEHD